EKISSWNHYSKRFEDKVIELRSKDKNFKDKIARVQIYNKMRLYLTGITDEYLHKITSKARKINKLFGYNYDSVTLKKNKDQITSAQVGIKTVNTVHDQTKTE
ncbi:9455_t:CDS:2, partial [Diversispora eburnea]